MQLRARIERDGHAYVIGFLRPPHSQDYYYVRFLVDTGCSVTTLLSDDAARLCIDCSQLPQSISHVTTANGKVRPWVISQPDLHLVLNVGFLNHKVISPKVGLYFINCMSATGNPNIPYDRTNSALGMDILHFFKEWTFKKNMLIMKG